MIQDDFALPLRRGRKVGRTLYDASPQGDGDQAGRLVGVMDTPEWAALVVGAVNAQSRIHAVALPQRRDPGLWFEPRTARERYVQQALVELHAAIGAPHPLREPSDGPGSPETESQPSDTHPRSGAPGRPSQALGDA